MRLLLDTHALLWWLFGDRRLSKKAHAAIAEPSNEVFVSAASAWEIGIKYRIGRLESAQPLVRDYEGWLQKAGLVELPITAEHALKAAGWEVEHRDPFDRMLAAQGSIEGLRLVTRDPLFDQFGADTFW